MPTLEDLKTPINVNFCPGCGDLAIWTAFKEACVQEGWDATNTCLVAGIGCHGHMMNFIKLPAFEGLHGRSMPVASGVKMANHNLNVFVFTGDGDCLSEGGLHFMHAARRNQDLTVLLHDNAIYGLTTGQTSPRTPRGMQTKSTPLGNIDEPLHPLRIALAAGATFVARVYSGNIPATKEMIVRAQKHKGFAVVQILQPCVTFNKLYSHWFFQSNIYQLGEDYDARDKTAAFAKTLEWVEPDVKGNRDELRKAGKQIPVGILYMEERKSQEELLPVIHEKTLVEQRVEGSRDISKLVAGYM